MNKLPNILSVSRIVLVIPALYFLQFDDITSTITAAVFFLIAFLTDAFDGFLARKYGVISKLGKILDPIADKICIGLVIVFLLIRKDLPGWFVIIVLSKDMLILFFSSILLKKLNLVKKAHWTGKITTGLLVITVVVYVLNFENFKSFSIISSLVFITISLIVYLNTFIKEFRRI